MANEVTLMVLQGDNPTGPPKFFFEDRGVWRNMGGSIFAGDLAAQQQFVERTLFQLMEPIGNGDLPPAGTSLLPSFHQRLYQALVPEGVRRILTETARSAPQGDPPLLRIHLDERLEWIPWEVMRDDASQEFLGLRFQIARLPITVTGPDLSERGSRKVKDIFNLLGKEVLEDNPGLMQDWKDTFAGIHAGNRERRRPENGAASNWPTQGDLEAAANGQIVHVTCHGGLLDDAAQERFWTFNLSKSRVAWNRILPSSLSVLHLAESKPLVFGNAWSSTAGAGPKLVPGGLVSGFGPSFFAQGAIAFVGTFAPVSRTLAVKFARRFYESLLANPPVAIARALWQTKLSFATANPSERDPSYLFYCLYGPPDTTFELANE